MLYQDGFLLPALPMLPSRNDFTERSATSLPTGSRPLIFLFSFSRLLCLSYEPPCFILLCPLTSAPFVFLLSISKLAGLAVKPRPFPSSRKDNEATHPLMLFPFSYREAFLAWPTFLAWTSPFLSVKLTLSSPCSRSNPSLRCQGAALSHFDSL